MSNECDKCHKRNTKRDPLVPVDDPSADASLVYLCPDCLWERLGWSS